MEILHQGKERRAIGALEHCNKSDTPFCQRKMAFIFQDIFSQDENHANILQSALLLQYSHLGFLGWSVRHKIVEVWNIKILSTCFSFYCNEKNGKQTYCYFGAYGFGQI